MNKISNAKKMLASLFIIMMAVFTIRSNAWIGLEKMAAYIGQDVETGTLTMSGIESEFVSTMLEKQSFIRE